MTAEWMTLTFKPQQYLVLRYWPKSTGIYFTTAASQAGDYAIDHFSFFPSRQTVMSIFFRLKYNHHSTAMAFLGKSSQPLANLQFYSHHNTRCPACVMKQKQFRNQRTVWHCVTETRCVCHYYAHFEMKALACRAHTFGSQWCFPVWSERIKK